MFLAVLAHAQSAPIVEVRPDPIPAYVPTDTRHDLNLAAGGLRQRRFEWTRADKWLFGTTLAASSAMVYVTAVRGGNGSGPRPEVADGPLLLAAALPLVVPITHRRGWDGQGGRRYLGRHGVIAEAMGVGVTAHLTGQALRCSGGDNIPKCGRQWGIDGLAIAALTAGTTGWLNVALIGRHEHGWSGVRGWVYQLGPLALNSAVASWQVQTCARTPACEATSTAAIQSVAVGWLAGMALPHLHRGVMSKHSTWSDTRDRKKRPWEGVSTATRPDPMAEGDEGGAP